MPLNVACERLCDNRRAITLSKGNSYNKRTEHSRQNAFDGSNAFKWAESRPGARQKSEQLYFLHFVLD